MIIIIFIIIQLLKKLNKGRIREVLVENINRSRITRSLLKSDKTGILKNNLDLLQTKVDEKIINYNKNVGFPDPGITRQWSNQIKKYGK